jgi:hypothetical protein
LLENNWEGLRLSLLTKGTGVSFENLHPAQKEVIMKIYGNKTKSWATGLFLLASVGGGDAWAITVIDTTPTWNGSDGVSAFGEPGAATYGQSFTVTGTETHLDSFSFWLNDFLNPDAVDFAAYVMAWDGTKATGSIL